MNNSQNRAVVRLPKLDNPKLLVYFFTTLGSSYAYYLILYLTTALNTTTTTACAMISIYGIGTIVGGLLGGYASDKFNIRRSIILSLIIEIACTLSLTIFTQKLILTISLFALGCSFYSFKTLSSVWIIYTKNISDQNKVSSINTLYVLSNLGLGIALLFITLLKKYHFTVIFLSSAALLFIAAIMTYVNKEPKLKYLPKTQKTLSHPHKQPKKSQTIILSILLSTFLIGLLVAQRRTTYIVFIHSLFSSRHLFLIGILLAINPILIVLLQNKIVPLFSKIHSITVSGIGGFLIGLGLLFLVILHSFLGLLLAGVIYTIGEMLFFAYAQLTCLKYGKNQYAGRRFGAFQSIYALSIVFGPLFGGTIYSVISPNMLWFLCGGIGLFCLIKQLCCRFFLPI